MKQVKLTLPPPLNSIYRYGSNGVYKTTEAKDWTEQARWVFRSELPEPYEGDVELLVAFHVQRDRDIDGGLKLLMDSLEGFAYFDDKQVVRLDVVKIKSAEPCTYVKAVPAFKRDLGSPPELEYDDDHKKSEPF